MPRQVSHVPFGYEPKSEQEEHRGSLWVYDSFQAYDLQQLRTALELSERKKMAKTVFYPLHEETLRRMGVPMVAPYYHRVDTLQELLAQSEPDVDAVIERWEGRRKKYTPMDTAFRFLADKYPGPHFVYVSGEMANIMASFESFEHWIKQLRLFIRLGDTLGMSNMHPRLQKYAHRWQSVE
ncbi:hypothetical protein [Paenibacillus xerothermodurans]|uniref:Uncharacterized protein n=1 Tax=Paenibacillus xerothermodurans TaxID=1977292 RepID=A0A2W1NZ69_PAEXE|nr:hypothetical protein [Paenibacillus xerothermodurans]PZE20138.1 hypothetical protein CBW46_014680 [Paenibacillus xerothermodurans]